VLASRPFGNAAFGCTSGNAVYASKSKQSFSGVISAKHGSPFVFEIFRCGPGTPSCWLKDRG